MSMLAQPFQYSYSAQFFFGMPSAAIIAGQYLERQTALGSSIVLVTALTIVWASILSNLKGAKTGSAIQTIVALALFFLELRSIVLQKMFQLAHL